VELATAKVKTPEKYATPAFSDEAKGKRPHEISYQRDPFRGRHATTDRP